ncbi:hypothetical protein [Gorillibacterium massiliense]|uniref:hypothetical protein n=1 Tax=Gorillibacterium massiliense TaxID=1280390 RepID=UPI0004AF448B|nr:hypothetical protein [Gorillibacterium massiliense]
MTKSARSVLFAAISRFTSITGVPAYVLTVRGIIGACPTHTKPINGEKRAEG